MFSRFSHWIPAIGVAILISVFSTHYFSGEQTSHIILPGQGWRPEWALITLLIAVSYAGLDELHQSFLPMREARFRDVLIDSTGAVLAQTLAWGYAKFNRNSLPSPELKEKAPR